MDCEVAVGDRFTDCARLKLPARDLCIIVAIDLGRLLGRGCSTIRALRI